MTLATPGRRLRDAAKDVTIQIPGAFNALVARMAESAGFDAVYLSGAALSAGVMALPDVGLFSLTELAQQTAYIAHRIDIPVIVDADTGFGAAVHVERTIVELEGAGAAAVQLEDQLFPKRCGHLSGKQLIDPAEMQAERAAAIVAELEPSTERGTTRYVTNGDPRALAANVTRILGESAPDVRAETPPKNALRGTLRKTGSS